MKSSIYSLALLTSLLTVSLSFAVEPQPNSRQVRHLVGLSKWTLDLIWSHAEILDEGDIPDAVEWVGNNPGRSSLHVLMVLRRQHPKAYASIAADAKARILIDVLKHTEFADDWSYMSHTDATDAVVIIPPKKGGKERPIHKADQVAAQALLELPPQLTVSRLIEGLYDKEEIVWSGSAESMWSRRDHLRRCDLAYRYICILTGIKPEYTRSVKYRDQGIVELMKKLGEEKGK